MTPSDLRARRLSSHWRVAAEWRWMGLTTVPTWAACATSSTPRMISTAHGLSRSLNTRSIRPAGSPRRDPRRWEPCWANSASLRARVVADVSDRPLRPRDTVGTDTPASAAMTLIVTLRSLATAAPACETFGKIYYLLPMPARPAISHRRATRYSTNTGNAVSITAIII